MTQLLSTIKSKLHAEPSKRNSTIDALRIILAMLVAYLHLSGKLYNRQGLDGASLVSDDIILILAHHSRTDLSSNQWYVPISQQFKSRASVN